MTSDTLRYNTSFTPVDSDGPRLLVPRGPSLPTDLLSSGPRPVVVTTTYGPFSVSPHVGPRPSGVGILKVQETRVDPFSPGHVQISVGPNKLNLKIGSVSLLHRPLVIETPTLGTSFRKV